MSINYMDTISMYYECPFDIRGLFNVHWIWDNKEKNQNLHNFCIKLPHAFARYFPSMYGVRRLYITISLPKLYYQSNHNTDNVSDYDNGIFMKILYSELTMAIDVTQLQTTLSDWQPSRIDLFRMRTINPADRLEYQYAYSRLEYRGVKASKYMNTDYLPSSQNICKACTIIRMYDKTLEEQEKRSLLFGNLPLSIEQEQENLMRDMDIPADKYRYEFSLRRSAIVRFLRKNNLPVNMETMMRDSIQKRLLNHLVISRHLHCHILSKKEYRQVAEKIFYKHTTKKLALKLAESIRNNKPVPMSSSQEYYIRRTLNGYYINTATTGFLSIKGLELLS